MKKQSLWPIVFEFLSIVFAVLLALGLNSYKENWDLQKESEVLSKKIILECRKNSSKLDSVITQNQAFKSYLDSLLAQETVTDFSFDFNNKLLSASAWKFTQISRSFPLMDQEFLDYATEMYEVQNYYMTISNNMFQNLGEMIMKAENTEPRIFVLVSHYYLTNILDAALALRKTYQGFLNEYDIEQNQS